MCSIEHIKAILFYMFHTDEDVYEPLAAAHCFLGVYLHKYMLQMHQAGIVPIV
jgi:hypothetical protein